ncbi:hypothetical protein BT69DRAFT_1358347 [Atractiella rhizophila]|nr:hypothetical protein BT69DRAFT_1358347 [Atractiella rhizophila]
MGSSTQKDRRDVYLFGPKKIPKFRSANEFAPHLYWLATHRPPGTIKICECKYCAGKKLQREVNRQLGLEESPRTVALGSVLSNNVPARRKRKRVQVEESFAVYVPPKEEFDLYPGPFVSLERIKDLDWRREGFSPTFRPFELVWLRLQIPFREGDLEISYWPAIVKERKWKAIAHLEPSTVDGSSQEIKVKGEYVFTVMLLVGTDTVESVHGSLLLPWLAQPYQRLLAEKNVDHGPSHAVPWIADPSAKHQRPVIRQLQSLKDAHLPYLLALSIGTNTSRLFHLFDPYDAVNKGQPLASVQSVPSDPVKETIPSKFFQGMWYGAEKIWVGELVRLKFRPRWDLSSTTAFEFKPHLHSNGLILKLDAIFLDPEAKQIKVSGTVYDIRPTQDCHLPPPQDLFPPPPPEHTFFPLTPAGKQHTLPITSIAGRFYPSPSIAVDENDQILALTGRKAKSQPFMPVKTWCETRMNMFIQAERVAEKSLADEWKNSARDDGLLVKGEEEALIDIDGNGRTKPAFIDLTQLDDD